MDLLKKILPILFLFLFSYCTTTVDNNDDDDQINISIIDAWFDDIQDYDQDGYVSSAALYFDIESNKSIELVVLVGIRPADPGNTTSYSEYFTSAKFEVSGMVSKFVPIGDTYGELPAGAYDFLLQVFQADDLDQVIVEVSAANLTSLRNILFEQRQNDPAFVLQLKNTVFTDITLSISGFSDEVLSPGDSINYLFTENPGSVTYYGETSGKTTSGSVVGIPIYWSQTINTNNPFRKISLVIKSDLFFAYMRNNGSAALSPVYVNYGRAEQTMDNVLIPNDGVTYRLGYYKAFNDTQVRAHLQGTENDVFWNQGEHFFLPWTDNQTMVFVSSFLSKSIEGGNFNSYGSESLIQGEIPQNINLNGESSAAKVKE